MNLEASYSEFIAHLSIGKGASIIFSIYPGFHLYILFFSEKKLLSLDIPQRRIRVLANGFLLEYVAAMSSSCHSSFVCRTRFSQILMSRDVCRGYVREVSHLNICNS